MRWADDGTGRKAREGKRVVGWGEESRWWAGLVARWVVLTAVVICGGIWGLRAWIEIISFSGGVRGCEGGKELRWVGGLCAFLTWFFFSLHGGGVASIRLMSIFSFGN